MLTKDQASLIIDYLEVMEERTNHQANMLAMAGQGTTEKELDEACRALASIAQRSYSLLLY